MSHRSHEKHIKKQKAEILETAEKILSDSIDIIEGCRKINTLWLQTGLPEDESYTFFDIVNSETETFPKGFIRKFCTKGYLKEQAQEEKDYLNQFLDEVKEECKKIIERLKPSK